MTVSEEIERAQVIAQLDRILSDRRFASSTRHADFLRYVVTKTLDGNGPEIKEVVIATELYGRPADYDPKVDSIVRVEATRLRAKLDSYYEQAGVNDPVRITIPKGTYVPQFEFRSAAAAEQAIGPPATGEQTNEPVPPQSDPVHTIKVPRNLSAAGLIAVLLLLLAYNPTGSGRSRYSFAVESHTSEDAHPEALIAWKEGNDLLALDPHSAVSDRGTPMILERAIQRYELAVEKDPLFARAWASLAEAYDYAQAYVGRDWDEDARRAEAAARRAITLDDQLAAGHAMLGLVLFSMRWDFAAAEKEYRRTIELDPRSVYAIVEYADLLRDTGRAEQAAAEVRKARALLPMVPVLAVKEAEIQLDQKQPDGAIQTANSALRMNRDYLRAHVVLGMAWEAKGDFEQALSAYRTVITASPQDRRALPALGYLLGKLGRKAEAQAIARKLEDLTGRLRNMAYQVAVVHAGLGDTERALDWLERACQTRQALVPFMAVDYRLRGLRNSPRFRSILDRVGLKPV